MKCQKNQNGCHKMYPNLQTINKSWKKQPLTFFKSRFVRFMYAIALYEQFRFHFLQFAIRTILESRPEIIIKRRNGQINQRLRSRWRNRWQRVRYVRLSSKNRRVSIIPISCGTRAARTIGTMSVIVFDIVLKTFKRYKPRFKHITDRTSREYKLRMRDWCANDNVMLWVSGDCCKTTGGEGVKAASDSPPPPGRPMIIGGLRILSKVTELSGAVAVLPSGSPRRLT